jgi:ATP-binding cassette subfamily C protein
MTPSGRAGQRTAVDEALVCVKPALRTALVFGLFINLLLFVSPLYMLQLYDRAIPSRSGMTLAGLTVLALYLTAVYATLDWLRGRVMAEAGRLFDEALAGTVFNAVHRAQLATPGGDRSRALRDVDALRDVITGPGLIALTDVPAIPVFITVCFLLHPWFGALSIAAAALLLGLTIVSETATRDDVKAGQQAASRGGAYADAALRNGEVLRAMSMLAPMRAGWLRQHAEMLRRTGDAARKAGQIAAVTKFVRLAVQTAVLGTGAWLAIQREISPGSIIAASIILGRVVSPVEMIIANWKGFIAAREAKTRLVELLAAHGAQPPHLPLPKPKGVVELDQVSVAPPGGRRLVLQRVSFRIEPGETLAVIGPSASGKSSLARVLCGVWQPMAGTVRLDGAELRHWDPEALGEHIGYLPQDVELFAGTVAQNIARFREAPAAEIVETARLAGCHDMIQALPDGYNTEIGEGGAALSGGQRQRIGLARAFFGMPPLVVLDEPNANLDGEGEAILVEALRRFRNAGRTIVLITHRPSVLAGVDKVLVIAEGQPRLMGPRDEVLTQLNMAAAA